MDALLLCVYTHRHYEIRTTLYLRQYACNHECRHRQITTKIIKQRLENYRTTEDRTAVYNFIENVEKNIPIYSMKRQTTCLNVFFTKYRYFSIIQALYFYFYPN